MIEASPKAGAKDQTLLVLEHLRAWMLLEAMLAEVSDLATALGTQKAH
jgi:hypothetical protein